jgi:cell division protein ZapA (FtsZ GTPase activity inhibitor)
MIKKEPVLEILINEGVSQEKAEEIVNKLRIACHQQFKDDWTEKESNLNRLLNDEKIKMDNLYKKTKEIMSNNIAQLHAVNMLFDLMTTGYTHRQKEQFCTQSKKVIELQIEKIKTEIRYLTNGNDMPF